MLKISVHLNTQILTLTAAYTLQHTYKKNESQKLKMRVKVTYKL